MVSASIQDKIDRLARIAVGTDTADLSLLVEVAELASAVASELSAAELASLSAMAQHVRVEVESIVFRQSEAPEAALREAHRTIDELQRACASAGAGSGPGGGEGAGEASGAAVDASLLSAWITGCDGMLGELEAQLLALERRAGDGEALGEIRRVVHTLKGECGVLGLHGVQKLCHEAETLLDCRVEAGKAPAVDVLLALVDWLKDFVGELASNPKASWAGQDELLARIVAAQTAEAEASVSQVPAGEGVTEAKAEVAPEPTVAVASAPETPASSSELLEYVPGAPDENLSDFLCEAREHIAGAEEALLALDHDAANPELINTVFRAFHTIKGVAGFLHLTAIVGLSHRAEQLLDGARSGTLQLGSDELDVILASCDMLVKLLTMVEGGTAPVRVDYESLLVRLDRSAAHGGGSAEVAAFAPAAARAPEAVQAVAPVVAEAAPVAAAGPVAEREAAPAAKEGAKTGVKRADQSVKVSTSRMDNLVTMVGELVIAQQMVSQDAATLGAAGQGMQRTLSHVQKIVRDLQEVSMALRMVSVKNTFQRMTRLVRDVSLKASKQIVCEIEGEDVELDRNVVEEITDPLVHMIRNACDHGLECAEERVAAGKPAVGKVKLKAYHSGGSIVIEIGDDGRGLRREKILAKAKSKGLVAADVDEKTIPDSEVFALIFLPGFSTAEKVTDISGRGVGMDVVRRNIEALRGKIEIRSVPGHGTTFLMRLPLTMAIIDGMVVRVGEQRYVLPTLTTENAFLPQEGDVTTVVGRGELVNVRGNLLPVFRLGRMLGLEGSKDTGKGLLVVVETGTSRCALLVDEILGQQQVVIKSLGLAGMSVKGVAGGAILGDGRVALILDVAGVVAHGVRAA